ncbi:protein FAR1-RELATED SEQUENCE 5-like [Aegilops tauschii subsp. strangulata]|uniref:protein FAR1-RELATED SEQUENCE 5-like n=1 Tax=Aegilops tauschii subsp. strangulata TaxID=200361 RepID=UPI00098A0836|nr:protein FAR1-RELATED SEQUENCE 5-like [Aegilops tauschii subsp. strangulata]
MATTISMVFLDSAHRCCKWHIFRVARTKLGKMLGKDEPFAEAFYGCINGSNTVEEFKGRWQQMVELFGVADKKHLKNMWNNREMWPPVYFRHKFFPFTGTTGRSESLDSYFKTLNHHRDSIWIFVQQFELFQELMLDHEDNVDFINEMTRPPPWGNYNIEKQAADFYTRDVFSKFQKLLAKSTSFGLQYQVQGDVIWLCLVANDGVNPKLYTVHVAPEDQTYMCSCNMFEMCGLICPHIICVMVQLNVQNIPATYMLPRWSKRETDLAPEPGDGHRAMHFGVPTTNTLKFNSLCRKFGNLASDACFSDEAYNFVSGLIEQGTVGVAAMKARARDGVVGDEEAQGHEANEQTQALGGPNTGQRDPPPVGLWNPTKLAKNGRPKEKEKRRKPLIELREDEMKKKAKKDAA